MPNIRLVIEYNGARFHGWQIQPGLRTVEEELGRALRTVLREEVGTLYAAGRTDAGVHARGQVVNFRVDSTPDLGRLARSISSILRGELTVLRAEQVPDDFHSRRSATLKQYRYTIYHRECPPVLDRGRVWYVAGSLDIARMQREALALIGTHDFSSMRGSGCTAKSPLRDIVESEVTWNPPYLEYRTIGRSFLKQMVRNIAGTLVDLGLGKFGDTTMQQIIEYRDRRKAGVTAPGYGLCLDWVQY